RLVGLAPQAGGDEKDVAIGSARIVARVNPLVAAKGAAVEQVQRFALGQVPVGIEDLNFSDETCALQGKRSARADAATAANDGDFHNALCNSCNSFNMFNAPPRCGSIFVS